MITLLYIIAGKTFSAQTHNEQCLQTLALHEDRLIHFLNRMDERGDNPQEVIINIVNVDDPVGKVLTGVLMPGNEEMWQSFRDQGMTPFALGLATRLGYQRMLDQFVPNVGTKLRNIPGKAVIVIDHKTVDVFDFSVLERGADDKKQTS